MACSLLLLAWPVLTATETILGFTSATQLKELVKIVGWLGSSILLTLIFRAWARGFSDPLLKGAHRMMSRFILWFVLPHAAAYSWSFVLSMEQDGPAFLEGIPLDSLLAGTTPLEIVALVIMFLLLYATQLCLTVYPLVAFHRFDNAWKAVDDAYIGTSTTPPNPLRLTPDDSAEEAAEKIVAAQDLRYRVGRPQDKDE